MSKLTVKGEVFTTLVIEVFRANRRLLDTGDQMTKDVDLSSALWQVLGALEHGPNTFANIARDMGLTRQAVRQTANILVKKGLIEYRDNPHHRRSRLVQLTPKGQKAFDFMMQKQAVWANQLSSKQSLRDLEVAVKILRNMRKLLEESKIKKIKGGDNV